MTDTQQSQTVVAQPPLLSSAPESEPHGLYRAGFVFGRLIYRARWLVLAIWVAGLLISVPFAARIGSALNGYGLTAGDSESSQASQLIASRFHQPAATLQVVFQSNDALVADASYQEELGAFEARAAALPHVTRVTPGPASASGRVTYVSLAFNAAPDLAAIEAAAHDAAASGPAKAYVTGDAAYADAYVRIALQDTDRAKLAVLPFVLLALLIIFGAVAAALLPLALALVAVPVALAVLYIIALHTTMNVYVLNIVTATGLGLAIDYSLFLTRRFREELANGRDVRDAVGWTVATAGESILFSAMAVMIGFAGLLLIGAPFLAAFGAGGACVVGAAMLAALTLLPALLGILGHRVNSLRLPILGKLTAPRPTETAAREGHGFWRRWASGVMRHSALVLLAVATLLVVLAWPLTSLNLGTPSLTALPATEEAKQGLDILTARFPQTVAQPFYITLRTSDGSPILSAANLEKVDAYTRWLAAQPHVTAVQSLTQPGLGVTLTAQRLIALYTSGAYQQQPTLARVVASAAADDTTFIIVSSDTRADTPASAALIDHLRANKGQAQGLTVLVTGYQAGALDFTRSLYDNFPKALVFVLLATFLALLVMFRSLLIPLKAVMMNALSVAATYGVLVFVFQQGHFASLLGFTSDGYVDSPVPILLFCILFGLSMDYEAFLLGRIREEWLRTGNNRYAIARGLETTAGVITSAALLFALFVGSSIFTRLPITKEFGLGMTVAVILDATIVRTLLVPATMRLLGRWNWWLPGWPVPRERPAPTE